MTKHIFRYASWTLEEDEKLKAFTALGLPWKEVARLIPGRTVAACQTRYEMRHNKNAKKKKLVPRMTDPRLRPERVADGEPIFDGNYVFRVPAGDPYLQRLIAAHGKDTLNRDVILKKVA